jgi:hypothetical protein
VSRSKEAADMPTDLDAASARKRAARAETQADITSMALVWAIISLGILVLMLLLADQSFSLPKTEWDCLF